tara:strand:- start:23436 stop:23828 length:393 start_codon:yes stop_codon:yes gene_type:complete
MKLFKVVWDSKVPKCPNASAGSLKCDCVSGSCIKEGLEGPITSLITCDDFLSAARIIMGAYSDHLLKVTNVQEVACPIEAAMLVRELRGLSFDFLNPDRRVGLEPSGLVEEDKVYFPPGCAWGSDSPSVS